MKMTTEKVGLFLLLFALKLDLGEKQRANLVFPRYFFVRKLIGEYKNKGMMAIENKILDFFLSDRIREWADLRPIFASFLGRARLHDKVLI